MKRTFRKLLEPSPTGSGDAPPVFRITSTNLDRHQDRVLALKAAGDEVRVPLLWQHDRWGPAIGFARCFREAGQWVAALHFDGADELSRTIAAKVKAGTLSACSIGFRPAPEAEPVPNQEGGYDFPLVELLELSVVNVPANQDAVRVRSLDGDDSGASAADSLKAYRDLQAACQGLVAEVKALVLALKAKASTATEKEEDEEAEDTEPVEDEPVEPNAEEADAEQDEESASEEDPSSSEDEDEAEEEDETASEEEGDEAAEEDTEEPSEEAAAEDEDAPEETTADEEPAPEEDSEDTADKDDAEQEEDEEELKALRSRVAKALGFSKAQADALPLADVRAYAALLPPTR